MRRQRARRQPLRRVGAVERARRHVVRPVGVEERGQQLDLAARDPELAHPAAVHQQPVGLAARVEREQPPQAAGAARLDVHDADRVDRRLVEVVGLGDQRVVGDAVGVRRDRLAGGGQVVRVLEDRVRERRDHVPVHGGEGGLVLDVHPVLALEVDDLDRVGGGEVLAQREVPRRGGVELEVDVGVAGEPAVDRVGRGRVAEAERVDEAQRSRLAPEHLVQRAPGLLEREVERRRLERPVAPQAEEVPARLFLPLLDGAQVVAEALQRPLARQRQRGGHLRDRIVVVGHDADVLAEPLMAAAVDAHLDRRPDLAVGHLGAQRVELVALDHERQVGELRPQAHDATRWRTCDGSGPATEPSSDMVRSIVRRDMGLC